MPAERPVTQRPEVAIVTGASRGIGAAIAQRAAKAGYTVVVNYSTDANGAAAVVNNAGITGNLIGPLAEVPATATKTGSPGTWVHYAASKGAVDVFTTGFAAEAAPLGIRVNAVAPGSTNTGLHAAAGIPHRVASLNHLIPLRNFSSRAVPAGVRRLLFRSFPWVG